VTARYLLDTDVCIYLMKRRSAPLLRRVDRLAPACVTSVVVYGELSFGLAASARRAEVSAHLAALIEMIPVLPLPLEAAGEYGSVRAVLERKGKPIGQNDLWVAAHALAADLTLVTNNEREFRRVPNLRVENWTR
jgi:tRNA(fMet)-specific endonuclease VapC